MKAGTGEKSVVEPPKAEELESPKAEEEPRKTESPKADEVETQKIEKSPPTIEKSLPHIEKSPPQIEESPPQIEESNRMLSLSPSQILNQEDKNCGKDNTLNKEDKDKILEILDLKECNSSFYNTPGSIIKSYLTSVDFVIDSKYKDQLDINLLSLHSDGSIYTPIMRYNFYVLTYNQLKKNISYILESEDINKKITKVLDIEENTKKLEEKILDMDENPKIFWTSYYRVDSTINILNEDLKFYKNHKIENKIEKQYKKISNIIRLLLELLFIFEQPYYSEKNILFCPNSNYSKLKDDNSNLLKNSFDSISEYNPFQKSRELRYDLLAIRNKSILSKLIDSNERSTFHVDALEMNKEMDSKCLDTGGFQAKYNEHTLNIFNQLYIIEKCKKIYEAGIEVISNINLKYLYMKK